MAKVVNGIMRCAPTGPDVQALIQAFGVPEEGVTITYKAVAAVIHAAPRTCRYNTVTAAWRAILEREHNVLLEARDGEYRRLNPSDRVSFGGSKLKSAVRSVTRTHRVLDRTEFDRLSKNEQKRAEHLMMISSSMIGASAILVDHGREPKLPGGVQEKR